jgi:hypothetical protein
MKEAPQVTSFLKVWWYYDFSRDGLIFDFAGPFSCPDLAIVLVCRDRHEEQQAYIVKRKETGCAYESKKNGERTVNF